MSDGYGAPVGPDLSGGYFDDTLAFGGRSFTFGAADMFSRPQVGFDGPRATFWDLSNYCNLTVSPPTCTEVFVDEFTSGQCATDIDGFHFASISAGLLRGLYATYDLDNLDMTFSEVKRTDEQDIEQA